MLSTRLGISRVTVNNMLIALQRPSAFEVLQAIPGPESLRSVVAIVATMGPGPVLVEEARCAIDAFATLIRDHFGTRSALNAAIGTRSDALRARVGQSGRAQVFNGMRQLLGVEAETWLTSMFFVPAHDDPGAIAVTTIHGPLGLRRLRLDTQVHFTFGAPYRTPQDVGNNSQSGIALDDLYTHRAAALETSTVNGLLRHRLVSDRLGKDVIRDMLAVSRNPRASRRHGSAEAPLRGVSVFVDVPVRTLVCDAIVHKSLFPGASPKLMVFNPGARGPANPNDPTRDVDRIECSENPVLVAPGRGCFDVSEVPNYAEMIERVRERLGVPADDFVAHRLVLAYPVVCFQYVMAFAAPLA
jgi:hypothetical protein